MTMTMNSHKLSSAMDVPLPQVLRDFCPLMSSSPYKLAEEYFDTSAGNSLGVSYPALNYQLSLPVQPGHSGAKSSLNLDDLSGSDVHVVTSCAPNFPLKGESSVENSKKGYAVPPSIDSLFPWEHIYSDTRCTSNTEPFLWNTACSPHLYGINSDHTKPKEMPVSGTPENFTMEMNMWDFPIKGDDNKNRNKMQKNDCDKVWLPEDPKHYDDPLDDLNPWYFGEREHDRAYTPVQEIESQEALGASPQKSTINFDGLPWFDTINTEPKGLPFMNSSNDDKVCNQHEVEDKQEKPSKDEPPAVASIYEDVSSDEENGQDNCAFARFQTPAIAIKKPSAEPHLQEYGDEHDKVDPGILCNTSNLSDFSGDSSEDEADDELARQNCSNNALHRASPSKNDDSGIDMNCSHHYRGKKVLMHHRVSVAKKRPMTRDNSLDASSEDDGSAANVKRKRRFCRKPSSPRKSANPRDPKFKGVTFQVKTRLQQNESQLAITAYFNCGQGLAYREQSRQLQGGSGGTGNFYEDSDSEGVDHLPRDRRALSISGKQCASCGTRKTPLWRDAEDGTPLCNACGIRYRKYRIRCGRCWYIPKKDNKMQPFCANCGEALKFSMFKSKSWS